MNASNLQIFQEAAEAFCTLATGEEPLRSGDLQRIRGLLLQLLFHIPAVEAHRQDTAHEGVGPDAAAYEIAVRRFGTLPFDFYRVVFAPHDFAATDEPVVGSLADDLADIYGDLAEGLDNARKGHLDEACFDWALSYRTHWCRHAVNALAAIEIYRTVEIED